MCSKVKVDEQENRRAVPQRAAARNSHSVYLVLILLLLPVIGSLGCCTAAVWDYGYISASSYQLERVLVSPQGDVCVICDVAQERRAGFKVIERVGEFQRCLFLTSGEIRLLAQSRPGYPYPVVGAEEVKKRIQPGDPAIRRFDERGVADRTKGWKEIAVADISLEACEEKLGPEPVDTMGRRDWVEKRDALLKGLLEEARKSEAAARLFGEDLVELPYGSEGRIGLEMAFPGGRSLWSYPIRVILTAPAVVADVAVTVVMFLPMVL